MIDTTTERPQSLDAYGRYEIAIESMVNLGYEIENLNEHDITSESSVFIAGLLLGRTKEVMYLNNFSVEDGAEEPGEEWRLQLGRQGRITAGDLQQVMIEAQSGDFIKLKQFILEQSAEKRKNANIQRDHEVSERLKTLSRKLEIVAEKIPDKGDGSVIKTPSPAWMEEPAPLRIQLQMLKEGKTS